MKVIKLNHPHSYKNNDFPSIVMALGFFDGVHIGHQKVINQAKEIAAQHKQQSAVMTFDPHPSVVLGKGKTDVHYITPLEDKIKLMAKLKVDYLFVVHFTKEFSQLLPEEFVKSYLIQLNVKHAVAGFDFTYGKFGKGTMQTLPSHAQGFFDVTIIPKLEIHHQKISSTSIRQFIQNGEMEKANRLLGRYFTTKGPVIHGKKRGRTLGFPTANIRTDHDYLLPQIGIYIVKVFAAGMWKQGVCSVGFNPTFHNPEGKQLSIEIYLLDFDQDIYGEIVTVEWHKRIRDEKKFNDIEQLKAQIQKDIENTREYFSSLNEET
ncbi:bifunctional riboflavin kinase/FAD synthetase [Lederbergia sp. NSJ-179]|uniref:bifunctional riboflavin kinase/FAD synthetase n=1 Tax=Lederbergia sp. NSJ-179 TaxID=2931402 RepID=UPI001FD624F4|nr:bifunctional riboflavin kinase/FAD synthetase [Lederbergia sp. NSJ-179]MCJ7839684.1 bifunctional riboflavin kinase/FAD synthetase [Lederbergia sp. NSJ-179]